jgi:ATP-dependent RNA helicase HelY
VRWAGRYETLARDTEALRGRVRGRTGSIARVFDQVCSMLDEWGYLDRDGATADGRRLAQVYSESDLVVAECLRRGLWDGLDPAGLAAVVSALLYEGRGGDAAAPPPPPAPVREALAATVRVWAELHEAEAAHRLDTLRAPDPGFAWAVHRWAAGAPLATVLDDGELTAGDFVRWCRQVLDLLDQIAGLAGTAAADAARRARPLLARGVVATAVGLPGGVAGG